MLAPVGTLRRKVPLASVTAPMEALPTTTMAAPTTGAPFASTTVPLMARFWAVATVPRRPAATIITAAAILAKNCLVIKALIRLVNYG